MRRRFAQTLLALLACMAAAGPSAALAAKTIGIAEQKQELFTDPRFDALGITHLRINVPWNVLRYKVDTAALDLYLDKAKARGASVLITVDRARYTAARHRLPSVADYTKQLKALHHRYPQVREWSAWNEANHSGQPTYRHPDIAARYWLALRHLCSGCTVLAADLLDQPNLRSWAKAFVKEARHRGGPVPGLWGLHNYVDANLGRTTGTRNALRAVSGRIWLTETAGLVSRHNSSTVRLPEGVAHAAKATGFILNTLLRLSPRIQRAYLYMWNATPATTTWDSAFIAPDNSERPALQVLRHYLGVG